MAWPRLIPPPIETQQPTAQRVVHPDRVMLLFLEARINSGSQ